MTPDIPTLTDLFGEPAAIIVAAFAIAQTEALKTGISLLALLLSCLWLVCDCLAWQPGDALQAKLLISIPVLSAIGSIVCLIIHGRSWRRQSKSTMGSSSP